MFDDEEIKSRFMANLTALLAEKGQTWSWLARETGESPARLHGYRHGQKMPNAAVVCRIAEALKVSIDKLLQKPSSGRRKKNPV